VLISGCYDVQDSVFHTFTAEETHHVALEGIHTLNQIKEQTNELSSIKIGHLC
jgi:hypothetical protein